jgi:hypothetical protein
LGRSDLRLSCLIGYSYFENFIAIDEVFETVIFRNSTKVRDIFYRLVKNILSQIAVLRKK